MYSDNMKQFRIRHIFTGVVLVSIAMGLITTEWPLAATLGKLLLVICIGTFFSYLMMFISDLIDDRRIDDRRLLSRFFNLIGLIFIMVTFLTAIPLGFVFLFQSAYWLSTLLP